MKRAEILMETGTNEIEIMKFTICDEVYGINVAKVKEIMLSDRAKAVPGSHTVVEGVFKPRDKMITIVDLPLYLTNESHPIEEKHLLIITHFNKVDIAFRVHSVLGIERMSWENVKKLDSTLANGQDGLATGIAECNGELIVILDFEKIVADIEKTVALDVDAVEEVIDADRHKYRILIAEDSELLASLITQALVKADYKNFIRFNNGKELWEHLNTIDSNSLREDANLIITDLEMPQMDGHRLIKLVRNSSKFNKIPILIFSSIMSEQMEIKGRELGADAQLSKPEIVNLINIIQILQKKWEQ